MRLIVLAALLIAVGCTQYAMVQPQRVSVKDAFTVEPDMAWNRFTPPTSVPGSRVELWTADGQALNVIAFFAGIEDGRPLFAQTSEQEKRQKLPEFKSSMTSTDVMELVEATYAKLSNSSLTKTRNLRPTKFGDIDGFRFEFSYVDKDSIDREAAAAGAVRKGRLYLIVYQGTRLYHHGLRLQQVERIIDTVRFVEG